MLYSGILDELNISWALMVLHCNSHYVACNHIYDDVCMSICDCSFEIFKHLVDFDELFEYLSPVHIFDTYRLVFRKYICECFPTIDDIRVVIDDFVSFIRYC